MNIIELPKKEQEEIKRAPQLGIKGPMGYLKKIEDKEAQEKIYELRKYINDLEAKVIVLTAKDNIRNAEYWENKYKQTLAWLADWCDDKAKEK